jgi:uncharacterized radical SAM superfamily Fe-S cluster-containing enzyme
VLIADDVDYYRRCREVFIKPPEMPQRYNTPVKWGCPYDCGLCTDHEQHSCLTLVEICDYCNLRCPICYAASGPERQQFRSLAEIERMLDAVVRNEGQPDVVQISGGEPTMHPEFFRVLEAAKARPIRHLMVNTNGVKIAESEAFTAQLASYAPDLEIYLQFDSFERDPLVALRGVDLRAVRTKALERLNTHGISTTLVVTLKKGLNDHEIGKIIDFAIEQPVRARCDVPADPGRRARPTAYDSATDRLTLTEVRRKILEQTKVFRAEDVIPVPCHPDALAMAYALKLAGKVTPLTGMIEPDVLINAGRKHDPLRAGPGSARRRVQAVCDEPLADVGRDDAARAVVLSAERARAGTAWLREHLSRDHHAVHRPPRVRRPVGEEVVRAHRASRWTDHPVRHLQPVLSGWARARRARALAN